ncbi:hypothetical protein [Burkholderia metallica]|uniref:hypothetical protein n=1 Tax=Burkholderia metallica TaxID=488729 RepID=UPI0014531D62|nr:hypothetical protein [Burkholderia metallica]VWB07517.1 membrane protein [Burkholderia metallica]
MLALKLVLVPIFLLLVSMSGKWWGPKVAGWLAGFPVVAGPILFLLALEKGPDFAAQAAVLSVSAICASEVFNFAYAWVCKRHAWPTALMAGLVAWFVTASGLSMLPVSIAWATGVAACAVMFGQRFLPRSDVVPAGLPLHYRDLALRMAAGAILTLTVTCLSSAVGAKWSGLLAVFPLLGIVLSVSSQRAHGPEFVVSLLRGMVLGRFSFAAFCLSLAVLLPRQGIAIGFAGALALSMFVQWGTRVMATLGPAVPNLPR